MTKSLGIIVLGPYRSGTSVTAQVLDKLGVNFGPKDEMFPPHLDWNPGGFFERKDVNDANDALIFSIGGTEESPGDPAALAERGDPKAFQIADLSWTDRSGMWGIKDPRLCATLLAWLEAGIFDRQALKIIHLKRDTAAAVKSAMLCPPVRRFTDGTEAGLEHMLARYARLAQWHVDTLDLPTLSIDYERLIKEPRHVVGQIADFIGVTRPAVIRKAVGMIGKRRSRFGLQLERLLVRGPRRVYRFLTGQGPLLYR